MKKDHNLDDLIIDDINIDKNKGKSVLTIVALLIVLLIMAIIMTRLFLGDNDQNATMAKQKDEKLISPELKPVPSGINPEEDKKELDHLSTMLEETLLNKKTAKQKDLTPPESSETLTSEIKPDTALIDESETSATLHSSINEQNKSQMPNKPAEENATKAEEPKVQESTTEEPKEDKADSGYIAQRPTTEKSKPKPVNTVVNHPTAKNTSSPSSPSSHGYYIQVGSFSKTPSRQFLSTIKKNGFRYQLKNGKLLIGPYSSQSAAKGDLPKVKDKIIKSAFIKHL